jgi:P22 coat protein - gene protein 5
MANAVLNPSIIAQTSVRILENELVMGRLVYRGFEQEFDKKVNGYDVGDTISIRKPQQFSVRTGATASIQDVTEGKLTLVVNQQQGVDFQFSSIELTLKIEELADRVIRPAMVRLANAVDVAVMNLFTQIPNWVGQPDTGADTPIDSFADFARGAQRLDQMSVPQDMRAAVLAPDSFWALAGSQTALFLPQIGANAYRNGEIGKIGGIDTYMSQNVPTFTNGNQAAATVGTAGTPAGSVLSTTYAAIANTEATPGTMLLPLASLTNGQTIKAGAVFTIGSGATAVKAVNPVTKAILPFQQMFTVTADVTISGTTGGVVITPPIIPVGGADGPQWGTTDQAAQAGATIQFVGDASASYRQNLMFHRDAFALVVVPMVRPPGAVDVARETYRNTTVRVIPYYDGTNDVSKYRLDILYGVKVVDNRLAVRVTGGTATLGDPSL